MEKSMSRLKDLIYQKKPYPTKIQSDNDITYGPNDKSRYVMAFSSNELW
jgi:hypothetical protein